LSWAFLLIACVLLSAAASVFLKVGAEALTGSITFYTLISSHMIWVGGFFYATAFLGYIYVLRVVPLSLAQPVITAGVSTVTALAAMVIFRESMSLVNWIGLTLIIVGIFFLFLNRA